MQPNLIPTIRNLGECRSLQSGHSHWMPHLIMLTNVRPNEITGKFTGGGPPHALCGLTLRSALLPAPTLETPARTAHTSPKDFRAAQISLFSPCYGHNCFANGAGGRMLRSGAYKDIGGRGFCGL